jgi:hypothetical protein
MKKIFIIGLLMLSAAANAEKKENFCWKSSKELQPTCALLTSKQIDDKIEALKKIGGVFYFFYPDRMPKK